MRFYLSTILVPSISLGLLLSTSALMAQSHSVVAQANPAMSQPDPVAIKVGGTAGNEQGGGDNVPPGYTMSRTGSVHDFDYFVGGWTTLQRRLKVRGVGSNEWEDFSGNLCMTLYLDGAATVDELYFPSKQSAGLTLRTFDAEKRQWFIYWVTSKTGKLDPTPVVGGFDGDRGEFYADDHEGGRPIKARFIWKKLDHDHARWEQAFSYDNQTWETNWTADFTRADTAKICENGKPRR
jgi:hypothetical protein